MTLTRIAPLAAGLALLASLATAQGMHDSSHSDDAEQPRAVGAAPTEAITLLDGAYSEDQAARGRSLYAEHCVSCHGSNLRGAGTMGPGIIGQTFADHWVGATVADLYTYVRDSMPKSTPGLLTSAEYADVLAYVLARAGYPSSETIILSTDPESQALVSIVARP